MRHSSIAAICLILAFCLQAVLAVPRLSDTSDEAVHLASGYSYWQTRDFRMNPEHPPLAKLFAALPLLVIRPKLNTIVGRLERGVGIRVRFRFYLHKRYGPASFLGPHDDGPSRRIRRGDYVPVGSRSFRPSSWSACTGTLRIFTESSRSWNAHHDRRPRDRLHSADVVFVLEAARQSALAE